MGAGSAASLSRYKDARLVSASETAELYSAVDPLLRRPVAIKVLSEELAADPGVRRRFARQALAAARLSGEQNVVTIYEVAEGATRPFVVMEYLPGGSLEDVLRAGAVHPPARAIRWLEEAARALDRAHEQGLVHGDLKPANLLLDELGHVRATDFGLAASGSSAEAARYRAPEQVPGLPAEPAADEYALAVIGRELLGASGPFEHASSGTAEAVFERALAENPADRFGSCGAFVAALEAALVDDTGRTSILPLPAAETGRSAWRGRVLPLGGLLLLAVGGAAAAIAATRHTNHGPASAITLTRAGTTVQRTVTADVAPVTVRETVTVRAPAAAAATVVRTVTVAPATAAGASTVSGATGSRSSAALALTGYRRLMAGDAAGALPLLRSAAASLNGTHTLAEAYNDFNLALAITRTQGCTAETRRLLRVSEAIQGRRPAIDRLRQACNTTG